jgi:hypothetical protein
MRDLLNIVDEATLEPSQIIKYPERFDAFITHIQDGKPFYTTAGEEVVLDPSEAQRFLDLKAKGMFKGGLVGLDSAGRAIPATTLATKEQLAIREFADALLAIPRTLSVNAE